MPGFGTGGLGKGSLGAMPLGGGLGSVTESINAPVSKISRKAYIKRRLGSTGLYEANWQEITEFVKRWGTLKSEIDSTRRGRFLLSGATIVVENDGGKFNDESNINSLWHGYLTRFRTLVKIEAGYEDTQGNIIPLNDTNQGIFILDQEIPISGNNEATLQCSSLKSVFVEEKITDVAGVGATQSASDIITKIKNHTDGSGNAIFQQFITSGAWTIDTTTTQYNFATSTSLDGKSCWDVIEKLGIAENKVPLITRTGAFEFRDRTARTTTSAFDFNGLGFRGMNIKKLQSYREPWTKYFTGVRVKFDSADTSTSYTVSGTTTAVSAQSLRWKYGQKVFEMENTFIPDTSTAQTIGDAVLANASALKNEIRFEAAHVPTLEVLDRITISYRSYDIAGKTLWDHANWDDATWDVEGENFDWYLKEFVVISKSLNVDNFMMNIRAREA